ncbi:MAG: ABC transporter ATP-binding protein [Actinobacteria bacterium]|jgi:iron complex transport system ATP-binding protein|nr:ABC transporter ATP-binding protein [Actinomycetota bacterium]
MIEIQDLTVRIGATEILKDLNLTIAANNWTCFVGPNGAGKTTLLKSILGSQSYAGSLKDDGVEVFNNHDRNVAFVPQHPQIPVGMSVTEYVMLGRAKRDGWGTESKESRALVVDTLKLTGLYGMQNQFITRLSGGEMQRALIARALVQQPELILLDEPTSALDLHHQIAVLNKIEILKEREVTIISTMHDITLAAMYADQIVVMKEGRILLSGASDVVVHSDQLKEAFENRINVFTLDSGRSVILPNK